MNRMTRYRMSRLRALAASTLVLSLIACGGGSGEGSASPSGPGNPSPGGGPTPTPTPAPAFTIDLSADKAVVLQGDAITVKATLHRDSGFNDAVQLSLAGLPAGTSAAAVTVPAGANEASIVISAQSGAAHSLPTNVTVQGQAPTASASHAMTVTVRGLPGVVDTSFAGGIVRQPVDSGEDYGKAMAVQADGKIIVAGSSTTATGTWLSLVRFQRDGSPDTAFGTGGKVITQVGTQGNDGAFAVAVQTDGKIVVAGASDQGGATHLDFAVLRYKADGSLDSGFGQGGKVVADFAGDTDRAWAVALQPDGKIVVGGEANTGTGATGVDFALLRLNTDGSLDTSFGNGGKVLTPIAASTGSDAVHSLALQTVQGELRILAVGGEGDFRAARYHADGTLDTGFGTQGRIGGLFNSVIGAARAVELLPNGGAVLAGQINHHFAAVQLTAAGTLDTSFAQTGRIEKPLAANWNEATALVRQSDGKLILGGWAYTGAGSSGDFAALRLNADGSVDTGFGTAGVTITATAPGMKDDQGKALVLQADERVPTVRAIQGGDSNDSNHDFTLIRLWL
jgi:uncharacterized delta-60 repeat protein